MTRPTKSIDYCLLEARIAIDNSLNIPVILDAVTLFGYDEVRLQAAQALYAEVLVLVSAKILEYGRLYAASALLQTSWDTADLAYKNALKIARIVFRGNEKARNALGLSGSRKKNLSGWISQATAFYTNLLNTPELLVAMTPYTYDQAKVEAEAALVQAVVAASAARDKCRGNAQESTKVRNAKLDELAQWVADYKAIAQIALSDSPQRLEQLGWVVAS